MVICFQYSSIRDRLQRVVDLIVGKEHERAAAGEEADGVFNGRQLAGGVDHDVEPLTVRIHENELLNAFGGWVDHEVGTELVSEGAASPRPGSLTARIEGIRFLRS